MVLMDIEMDCALNWILIIALPVCAVIIFIVAISIACYKKKCCQSDCTSKRDKSRYPRPQNRPCSLYSGSLSPIHGDQPIKAVSDPYFTSRSQKFNRSSTLEKPMNKGRNKIYLTQNYIIN